MTVLGNSVRRVFATSVVAAALAISPVFTAIAEALTLNGAGATFPAPLYERYFAEFSRSNPPMQVNYQAIGSGGTSQIAARRDGKGFVEIVVADDGPGLPQDLTDGRPVPFFTTKEDGIGVGLALSRTIIEAHGGELVLSNGTSGAQVAILLPLQSGRTGDGQG